MAWLFDEAKQYCQARRAAQLRIAGESAYSERLAALEQAVPVLVGPATLESLLEETPRNFIVPPELNLPFDQIFFEFAEPTNVTLPSVGSAELGGMLLRRGKDTPYALNFFYRQDGCLGDGNLTLANEQMTAQIGGDFYDFDFVAGKINTLDTLLARQEGLPFEAVPAWRSLNMLAALAYNTVNYINAHNVRMVAREEHQVKIKKKKHGKKWSVKRVEELKPYYLITFKDGLITEPTPTGRTWSATVRWIACGHVRHYRDDDGRVYKTTWIRPCIKGPEGAPWKHHRYALFADKLERERALYVRDPPKR